MGWKFWEKKQKTNEKVKKLPKPKELPSGVGRYLIVDLKYEPDWVWSLKGVSCQRENSKTVYDIRVFSEIQASEKEAVVRDYNSLNEHPDLILFEGWYDKDTWAVKIEKRAEFEKAA